MLPQAKLSRWEWHLITLPPLCLLHPVPRSTSPQPIHIDFWFLGFVAPSPEPPNSPAVVMAHTRTAHFREKGGSQVLLNIIGPLGGAAFV